MRYVFLVVVLAAVCAVPTALVQVAADDAESKPKGNQEPPAKEKPLLLSDDDPPLLLDDGLGIDPAAGADNSRCQVCHLNLVMEELAVTHAKEDIGCADCHGDCDAHIDDESWASGGPGTPPEIMYPPERIDGACGECHETHDAPAKEVLQRWQERCPEKTDASGIVCTDCHGKHRLNPKLRKAWWDKKTGEPIKPEGGQLTAADTD
jgi:hypothetical protein